MMTTTHTELSPAKINLYLKIIAKMANGYHQLNTLMTAIDLYDELHFTPAASWNFDCSDKMLISSNNLVQQAYQLFCDYTHLQPNYHVFLQKNIPHGAGLGGGSSNAAATLRALNTLTEANLSNEILEKLAGKLGADVAFFIRAVPAICTGVGDIITPLTSNLPKLKLLLCKPNFPVMTSEIFQLWSKITPSNQEGKTYAWGTMINDLEAPTFYKYPFLQILKEWLLVQNNVSDALMTGSGSTVFAVTTENFDMPTVIQKSKELDQDLWLRQVRII